MTEVLELLLPVVILTIGFFVVDGALGAFAWLGGIVVGAVKDFDL